MRAIRNAGLLYEVVPPSTNTNALLASFGSQGITSGLKYTGAAVLARTSCHSLICRLESASARSLYFAKGFELTGHAESVVALRVTTSSSVCRYFGSSVAPGPYTA